MYAIRETRNLNDVLLHWTEEGLEGLRWPHRFARYKFIWPDDVSRYSHYVRPPVQTEAEARETAVTLPIENVPIIDYQDPLDRPRGKLTETFAYYTFLEPEFPAHRALLRFTSGEHIAFELVFSWLASDLTVDGDGNLRAEGRLAEWLGAPGGSHPPRLSSWDPVQGMFNLPDMFAAPRVVESTVEVAQRIEAPGGEVPPGQIYWAGHIRREIGQSFNPFIYADPFVDGFDNANLSAIVPVNAIPGENKLEVWWFRANHADLTRGFQPIFWPSVIGRYTIEWPADAREIVLASNHGSGPLGSREAAGHIYYQNDPSLPGYNPNEEHALMVGGQAYALRDDLNIVGPGENYSSEPYVLIEYVDATGRPNMSAFRVLREKPEAGWVFDYVVEAGTILQAPMPLPLLPAPVEGSGAQAVNYNTEPEPEGGLGDLPVNWDPAVHGDGPLGHYGRFTFLDRNNAFWVYRGLHAGTPPLEAGSYDAATETFVAPVPAQVREGEAFRYVLHASQRPEALRLETAGETPLPDGLTINGLALEGAPWMKVGEYELTFILSSIVDGSSVELDWTLAIVTSVQNRL